MPSLKERLSELLKDVPEKEALDFLDRLKDDIKKRDRIEAKKKDGRIDISDLRRYIGPIKERLK